MSRQSSALFTLSTLVLSMYAVQAQAEVVTGDAPEVVLDEIVVIGSKENARKLAGSNYYVDSKQLENEQITDINQVMKTIPGVYVSEEDGLGLRPNISIRAGVAGRSSKVHLMEDGVPIAPAPYAAPAAYYHPTAARMSSVEVLKGAPLLRYGPQTTGGVINYLTTPIPSQNGGKVKASINDRGGVDVHAYIGGREGDFAGSIETVQTRGKGFKEINGSDIGDYTNQDYVLKGRYQVTPEHSLFAKVQHSRKTSDETYLGITDEDFARNPDMRYPMSAKDKMENEHTGINLTHNWAINENADLRTTAYYNKTHRNWYKLAGNKIKDYYAGKVTADQLHGKEDMAGIKVKANDRDYDSYGIQTNLNTDLFTDLGTHNINVGARYHKDSVERYQPVDTFDQVNGHLVYKGTNNGNVGGGDNRTEDARAFSLWATDTWQVTDPLTLNLALRYENIKTEENRYTGTRKQTPQAGKLKSNTDSILLPGISGTYQIDDNLQVLAGVHKGFIPLGVDVDSKADQKPETSVNYELGARYTNGNNYAEAIGFYSDFDGISQGCSVNNPCSNGKTSGSEKLGNSAVIAGLELTAGTQFPMQGYTIPLSATFTHTNAELSSDYDSNKKGDRLTLVPENQASVRTGVEMDNGWNTYLTAKYIGSMCESVGCDRTNEPRSKTDSLFTMDVATHYPLGNGATVFGKVENIADKRAIVSRTPYGARPNMPRTFTVGFTKEF
ncbi:TonB-dependent receptor family protein [Psychrobacter sp. I-STPA6b]|uniref:TonB-dependent receptor family protein n=1 Tax=Psychrobacter sp. I-STPA6b TaxID=2585718 RepID=UPI001D0C8B27|nr:TonB-dependent receptor [Psychrobacter sp. I-STPA6b]